jgi:uncharacterized protein YndB with AHSA1/START domain
MENPFVITRDFDAPRDQVWTAWSDAKALAQWWGPKGSKVRVAGFEFRPGGYFHYAFAYSAGPEMWGRFFYREIEKHERIVWINSFSNEGGGITRAPFGPNIPLEFLNTMTLSETASKTTLTLHSIPHGPTAEERQTFEDMREGLAQGFGGTMDQLSAYLAAAPHRAP